MKQSIFSPLDKGRVVGENSQQKVPLDKGGLGGLLTLEI